MAQNILHVNVLVHDYDEAIDFYVNKLKFDLVEDIAFPEVDKRWVLVTPKNSAGLNLVLNRAVTAEQRLSVGNQAGGGVLLFLGTDDFWRDYHDMQFAGVEFVSEPQEHDYGTVAIFKDVYGNQWDLIQRNEIHG